MIIFYAMLINERTIFAPATPIAESSISVIRISGKDALGKASAIFRKKLSGTENFDFSNSESHKATHGFFFDGEELVDEVVVTTFKSPNSFTGEDVVEISTHGGKLVYKKIVKALLSKGCFFAEPGEFSKRAFLNGKMDLVQAEAIADLIASKTELASRVAMDQLSGKLSSVVASLKQRLINYCSLLELEIDFTEEELEVIDKSLLINKLDEILEIIEKLIKSYRAGHIIRDGINIAIIGKPNTGKSSIFNYLLDHNRAIVSELPGTTRDYLEEKLVFGGFLFNLIDTAGIRESSDIIEKEGIRRSYQKIGSADIILEVYDLTKTFNEKKLFFNNNVHIKIFNKSDLSKRRPKGGLCISAKTGYNMEALENKLIESTHNLSDNLEQTETIIANERHKDCLLKTCEYLNNAKNCIKNQGGNELVSIEIRAAMNALSEIIGQTTNVDILNNIFSKFCIGK
jgi:tRNA modification GTPase